jgi:peptide/nickel transport system permease protein
VQFLIWLREVALGNFGASLRTGAPVTELIRQTLPVTIQLAIASLMIALFIGIPMGVLAAVKKGTWLDYVANAVSLSGLSIPNFWLGIILILFVSVHLRWLPASGFVSVFEDPVEAFRTTIMPAFVLGSGLAATLMRHTRSAMLEVLRLDYIRTARAKGLLEPAVVFRHALRNALVPIVTLSTLLFGQLLAGAVLTEQVFTIPGFGKLIVDAVFNRDYGVVQGVVLCTAMAFILMNLVADVLYILINPRLRTA